MLMIPKSSRSSPSTTTSPACSQNGWWHQVFNRGDKCVSLKRSWKYSFSFPKKVKGCKLPVGIPVPWSDPQQLWFGEREASNSYKTSCQFEDGICFQNCKCENLCLSVLSKPRICATSSGDVIRAKHMWFGLYPRALYSPPLREQNLRCLPITHEDQLHFQHFRNSVDLCQSLFIDKILVVDGISTCASMSWMLPVNTSSAIYFAKQVNYMGSILIRNNPK